MGKKRKGGNVYIFSNIKLFTFNSDSEIAKAFQWLLYLVIICLAVALIKYLS